MSGPPPAHATGTEDLSRPHDPTLTPVTVDAADGPSKGLRAVLASGTFCVGSQPGCDLVLADPAVSRQHLSVELRPGAVRIRDLGSRNGTVYLGARISEALVPIGGSVRVGRTTIRFLPAAGPGPPLSEREHFFGLIGRSLPMRRLFGTLEKLAAADSNVLIRGETGSGKEAVARALHAASTRSKAPFQVFDCGAVNANLIESELFGHARGAFTGAASARAGAVELALGGTLFLDEIGELPLALQPKLLRMLDAREFHRVGEGLVRRLTARVASATHRDLAAEVKAGRFREDLFYRLTVAVIEVPALRERAEDIPLLAEQFARGSSGGEVPLAPATLAGLQCDPWPGNVRELRNAVERVIALGAHQDLAPAPSGSPSFLQARAQLLEKFEADYLRALLARQQGNVSAAAREAKLSRRQFYRLLKRHQLGAADE